MALFFKKFYGNLHLHFFSKNIWKHSIVFLEEAEEKPMPQWKIRKMEEEAERAKPVVEKNFRVILDGLPENLKNSSDIKELTDKEKITPNKTFFEDKVILEYRQKKHALNVCKMTHFQPIFFLKEEM